MKRLSIWAGILFILSALFFGCSDDDQALPLQLRTSVVTDITETSATLGGKVDWMELRKPVSAGLYNPRRRCSMFLLLLFLLSLQSA